MTDIAIIAGEGRLPAEVASVCGRQPLVCALDELQPDGLEVVQRFRLERLVPFMRALVADGVRDVVLVGAMQRRDLDPELFDPETAAILPELMPALQQGDDATSRALIAIFGEYGLTIRGIPEVAPMLLADDGVLAARAPTAAESADAARAVDLLDLMSPADVGQGCVIASGLCLGLETLYGTDAMLRYVAANRQARHPQTGGVLVKRAKIGQEQSLDLPVVGPDTVAGVHAAGLSGIAVQAGQVVLLEREKVVAAVDAAGIALWSMP